MKIEDVVRRAGDSNQADSGLTLRGEAEEWGKKQSHWKKSWRGRGWKSHRRLGIESVWDTCVRVQRQHACEEENVRAKMTDDGGNGNKTVRMISQELLEVSEPFHNLSI